MNPMASTLGRGLSRLEALSGAQTFTWRNAEIACTPSSLMRGVTIEVGGNPIEIQLSLFVRLENFVTADSTIITVDSALYTVDNAKDVPVSGKLCAFRGKSYLILSAKQSGPQSHVELHLADPDSARS